MTYLLVRNRVADFDKWKKIFDAQAEPNRAAGLRLVKMWRDVENRNNVFFMFEAASIERANAYMSDPESVKVGEASGVIEGECHFLEEVSGS